eukprot:gene10999-12162_t
MLVATLVVYMLVLGTFTGILQLGFYAPAMVIRNALTSEDAYSHIRSHAREVRSIAQEDNGGVKFLFGNAKEDHNMKGPKLETGRFTRITQPMAGSRIKRGSLKEPSHTKYRAPVHRRPHGVMDKVGKLKTMKSGGRSKKQDKVSGRVKIGQRLKGKRYHHGKSQGLAPRLNIGNGKAKKRNNIHRKKLVEELEEREKPKRKEEFQQEKEQYIDEEELDRDVEQSEEDKEEVWFDEDEEEGQEVNHDKKERGMEETAGGESINEDEDVYRDEDEDPDSKGGKVLKPKTEEDMDEEQEITQNNGKEELFEDKVELSKQEKEDVDEDEIGEMALEKLEEESRNRGEEVEKGTEDDRLANEDQEAFSEEIDAELDERNQDEGVEKVREDDSNDVNRNEQVNDDKEFEYEDDGYDQDGNAGRDPEEEYEREKEERKSEGVEEVREDDSNDVNRNEQMKDDEESEYEDDGYGQDGDADHDQEEEYKHGKEEGKGDGVQEVREDDSNDGNRNEQVNDNEESEYEDDGYGQDGDADHDQEEEYEHKEEEGKGEGVEEVREDDLNDVNRNKQVNDNEEPEYEDDGYGQDGDADHDQEEEYEHEEEEGKGDGVEEVREDDSNDSNRNEQVNDNEESEYEDDGYGQDWDADHDQEEEYEHEEEEGKGEGVEEVREDDSNDVNRNKQVNNNEEPEYEDDGYGQDGDADHDQEEEYEHEEEEGKGEGVEEVREDDSNDVNRNGQVTDDEEKVEYEDDGYDQDGDTRRDQEEEYEDEMDSRKDGENDDTTFVSDDQQQEDDKQTPETEKESKQYMDEGGDVDVDYHFEDPEDANQKELQVTGEEDNGKKSKVYQRYRRESSENDAFENDESTPKVVYIRNGFQGEETIPDEELEDNAPLEEEFTTPSPPNYRDALMEDEFPEEKVQFEPEHSSKEQQSFSEDDFLVKLDSLEQEPQEPALDKEAQGEYEPLKNEDQLPRMTHDGPFLEEGSSSVDSSVSDASEEEKPSKMVYPPHRSPLSGDQTQRMVHKLPSLNEGSSSLESNASDASVKEQSSKIEYSKTKSSSQTGEPSMEQNLPRPHSIQDAKIVKDQSSDRKMSPEYESSLVDRNVVEQESPREEESFFKEEQTLVKDNSLQEDAQLGDQPVAEQHQTAKTLFALDNNNSRQRRSLLEDGNPLNSPELPKDISEEVDMSVQGDSVLDESGPLEEEINSSDGDQQSFQEEHSSEEDYSAAQNIVLDEKDQLKKQPSFDQNIEEIEDPIIEPLEFDKNVDISKIPTAKWDEDDDEDLFQNEHTKEDSSLHSVNKRSLDAGEDASGFESEDQSDPLTEESREKEYLKENIEGWKRKEFEEPYPGFHQLEAKQRWEQSKKRISSYLDLTTGLVSDLNNPGIPSLGLIVAGAEVILDVTRGEMKALIAKKQEEMSVEKLYGKLTAGQFVDLLRFLKQETKRKKPNYTEMDKEDTRKKKKNDLPKSSVKDSSLDYIQPTPTPPQPRLDVEDSKELRRKRRSTEPEKRETKKKPLDKNIDSSKTSVTDSSLNLVQPTPTAPKPRLDVEDSRELQRKQSSTEPEQRETKKKPLDKNIDSSKTSVTDSSLNLVQPTPTAPQPRLDVEGAAKLQSKQSSTEPKKRETKKKPLDKNIDSSKTSVTDSSLNFVQPTPTAPKTRLDVEVATELQRIQSSTEPKKRETKKKPLDKNIDSSKTSVTDSSLNLVQPTPTAPKPRLDVEDSRELQRKQSSTEPEKRETKKKPLDKNIDSSKTSVTDSSLNFVQPTPTTPKPRLDVEGATELQRKQSSTEPKKRETKKKPLDKNIDSSKTSVTDSSLNFVQPTPTAPKTRLDVEVATELQRIQSSTEPKKRETKKKPLDKNIDSSKTSVTDSSLNLVQPTPTAPKPRLDVEDSRELQRKQSSTEPEKRETKKKPLDKNIDSSKTSVTDSSLNLVQPTPTAPQPRLDVEGAAKLQSKQSSTEPEKRETKKKPLDKNIDSSKTSVTDSSLNFVQPTPTAPKTRLDVEVATELQRMQSSTEPEKRETKKKPLDKNIDSLKTSVTDSSLNFVQPTPSAPKPRLDVEDSTKLQRIQSSTEPEKRETKKKPLDKNIDSSKTSVTDSSLNLVQPTPTAPQPRLDVEDSTKLQSKQSSTEQKKRETKKKPLDKNIDSLKTSVTDSSLNFVQPTPTAPKTRLDVEVATELQRIQSSTEPEKRETKKKPLDKNIDSSKTSVTDSNLNFVQPTPTASKPHVEASTRKQRQTPKKSLANRRAVETRNSKHLLSNKVVKVVETKEPRFEIRNLRQEDKKQLSAQPTATVGAQTSAQPNVTDFKIISFEKKVENVNIMPEDDKKVKRKLSKRKVKKNFVLPKNGKKRRRKRKI